MAILVSATCEECGKAFAKRKGNQRRHCSEKCKWISNEKKKFVYTRQCAYPECNEFFTTKRKDKLYCKTECKKKHEAQRFQEAQEKELKLCVHCGKAFYGNKKQRYCCEEHAKIQKNINDRRRLSERS